MNRKLAITAAAILGLSALTAGTAHAAGGGIAPVDRGLLHYNAAPGDVNNIEVTKVGNVLIVNDVVPITPGAGRAFISSTDNTIVGCQDTGLILNIHAGDQGDFIGNATAGRAILDGADGNDTILGGDGFDSIIGANGDDELRGAAGNDQITGESGNDRIIGNPGADELVGGAGRDTIRGDDGNDQLLGNRDNDSLDGGSGTNNLDGGLGTDTCVNGPTLINCNP